VRRRFLQTREAFFRREGAFRQIRKAVFVKKKELFLQSGEPLFAE
jgi:hypothetical protein